MYMIWYFRSCGRASWVIMGRIMVICFQKPVIASDLPQFPCHIFDISSFIPTSIFSTTRTYTVSSWPQMLGISLTTILPKKWWLTCTTNFTISPLIPNSPALQSHWTFHLMAQSEWTRWSPYLWRPIKPPVCSSTVLHYPQYLESKFHLVLIW